MPSDYNDTGIATGAIANIQNGADSVPVKSWKVTLPASLDGYSEVNGTQTGINIWNESWETGAISETTGANTTNNNKIRPTGLIAVKPSTSFYIVCPQLIQILFYRKDETYIGIGSGYGSSRVFTTDDETYFIRFNVANAYGNTYNNDISVNYPSTDTDYHSHVSPTVSTVNLGRTIYGGSVDVVAGTGTEGYNKITLSSLLTDLNVTQIGTTGVYRIRFSIADAKGAINSSVFNGLCDYYTPITANQTYAQNEGISINTSGQCYIYDSRFNTSTSLNDFKTWIDANPVNLCYELTTGTDFTFTPITPTPETALGTNNFWGDTGDSEVTYYKDGYGFTSVTVHKETPEGEPVEVARKFHRIIYEGQVDVIRGTGLIYIGESGTQYDPPEEISFEPIEIATDEGDNTFYADEGVSVITYRRGVE